VPAARFGEIAARLDDCAFYVVRSGTRTPATAEALRLGHQTWALETAVGRWRVDVFREPHVGDDLWVCRRDPRIRRPYAEAVERTPDGIPYLSPEIVLLFKAKYRREKDEADFQGVLPLLDTRRRRWLAESLAVLHPGHPWAEAVDAAR